MEPKTDIDAIWSTLRPYGLYQIIQMGYIFLCALQIAFLILNIVFIGYIPKHTCKELIKPLHSYGLGIEGNLTDYIVEYRACDIYLQKNSSGDLLPNVTLTTSCLEGYNFYLENGESIVSEWNLVCDRSGMSELGQSIVMIGQILGALFFTTLGDKYGRKPIFVWTHILIFGISLANAFVPNLASFLIVRFILGALQQGMGMCSTVLSLELFPAEKRGTINTLGSIAWSIFVMILTGFGYFMRNFSWRYLQIATTLVSFHCIFGFCFTDGGPLFPTFILFFLCFKRIIDESLRWLVVNNKKEEAVRVIRKVAKINKVDVNKALSLLTSTSDLNHEMSENAPMNLDNSELDLPEKQNKDGALKRDKFIDIFKNRTLFRNMLLLWYIWIINAMTYYGLFMTSSSFAGNRFLNMFLSALVEVPGTCIYFFCVNRLSRKTNGIIFHCLAGVSLISTVILLTVAGQNNTAQIFATALNLLGKLAISTSWTLVFLYTPELFPTNLRNIGIGSCSAASRIGSMVAPYSRLLAAKAIWAPGLLFGSGCLVVTYLITLLPETKGRILPQTLQEFQAWSGKSKKERAAERNTETVTHRNDKYS